MESHHCTCFYITKLVLASSGVAICIEELGSGSFILREVGIGSSLVVLLVIVKNVVGFRSEELVQLFILKDGI